MQFSAKGTRVRQPALGKLIRADNGRDLASPYEFDIPLCDLLLDLVEQDIDGPDALFFTQIAHSFANDILSIATLASALLWYEGVTPDMSRSPDLLSISVNFESSLAFLRSACDLITPAFARFAVAPAKGRVSSRGKESFNGLLNWVGLGDPQSKNIDAQKHYTWVSEPFHFLERHSAWFLRLRHLRDKVMHEGYHLVAYTARVFLEGFLMPPGIAELKWLHGGYKVEDHQEDAPPRFKRFKLLETLKEFTTNTLALANDLSIAIGQHLDVVPSRTHFLSGVHIPALYQLLSYKTPSVAPGIRGHEDPRLCSTAWYLLRAGDYLNAHEEGYPNGYWWRFKTRLSAACGRPPCLLSDGWYIFCCDGRHYGVLTHDWLNRDDSWIKEANAQIEKFRKARSLDGVVLVGQGWNTGENGDPLGAVENDLLTVEENAEKAAEAAFTRLTKKLVLMGNAKWDDDPHSRKIEEAPTEDGMKDKE